MNSIEREREHIILNLLISGKEMYGLDMLRASPILKKHSLYTLLQRMESWGFIESREVTAGEVYHRQPRRTYKITPAGKHYLMEET